MKIQYTLAILFSLILVLLLPACAQTKITAPVPTPTTTTQPKTTTPAVQTPQYGGAFKFIVTGSISNIGQLGAQHEVSGGMFPRISRPAMETLCNYDNDERIVPKLAESFDASTDGKVMTIKVRKGIKFQDGTPWNAQALSDNLDMIRDSTVNAATAKSIFANVTGWQVVDEYTVKVNFSTFDAKFLSNMAERGMVSPTAAKKPTTPENMAKDHMIGTGPFMFNSYQRAQFLKYTPKNSNYWQSGKPYLDSIEINEISDAVTALLSFKKGEAHLIFGITPKDVAGLKADGFDILYSSAKMINYILPDGANKDSPWSNLKVRQAAEFAIDKKSLASLGSGVYEPVTQIANPGDARYVQGLTPRNYDPARAKQLLAEAGYPTGFKTSLIAATNYNREILVALQTYLKEVGIDAKLDVVDSAKNSELRVKGWENGILCAGVPLVGVLSSFFSSLGPSSYPSIYRGTWDQKTAAAVAEPNYDKRIALMKEMVKVFYDDAMGIPLWSAPDISAVVKNVKGDLGWMIGHPNFWEPQNIWLSK